MRTIPTILTLACSLCTVPAQEIIHESLTGTPWGHTATGTWNNARLLQFRTYNDHQTDFAMLLARHDGAMLPFMHDIQRLTRHARDPFAALEARIRAASDSGGD